MKFSSSGTTYRLRFVKVFPKEYQRALAELAPHAAPPRPRLDPSKRSADRTAWAKSPGFLEFQRLQEASEDTDSRKKHYHEFVHRAKRRRGENAGRALHGLRHPVLHDRLPGQQHHS